MDTEDIELSDIEDTGSEDSDNKPTPPDRDFLYLDEIDREHAETIRSFLQNHPSEQDQLLSQFAKIYKKKIIPQNKPVLKNLIMQTFESEVSNYKASLLATQSIPEVENIIAAFRAYLQSHPDIELPSNYEDVIEKPGAARIRAIENTIMYAVLKEYNDNAKNFSNLFDLNKYTQEFVSQTSEKYKDLNVLGTIIEVIKTSLGKHTQNLINSQNTSNTPMDVSETSTSTSKGIKRERIEANETKPAILHTSVAIKREGKNFSPIASNQYLSDGKTIKKSYEKFINSPALNRGTKKRKQRFRSQATEQIMKDVKAAFSTKHKLGKDGVKTALLSWKASNSGLSTSAQEAARKWSNWVAQDQKRIDFFGNPNSVRKESHLPYIPYVGGINRGSIAPYYVEMGVIRGGGHRKGIQVTNPKLGGSGHGFAIPMVDSTNRKLISLQAKYRNPTLYPRDRIIKFIAGRFGTDYPTTRTAGTIPTVTSRPF